MLSSDFADEFPNAEVIGTDITPIQPAWVPPNVKFEIDDCNQEWTWPDNSFDFVHVRMMFGAVEDWYQLHRQAFRTLKPGGTLLSSPQPLPLELPIVCFTHALFIQAMSKLSSVALPLSATTEL